MEEEDQIFDDYVETTVSIGQTLPLLVFGTTTFLVFVPVILLALRPSKAAAHENGDTATNVNKSLNAEVEDTESAPLVPSASADSYEYGGLSVAHSERSRDSQSPSIRRLGSQIFRAMESFDTVEDEEDLYYVERFSDPKTSIAEKLGIITLNYRDPQTKSMLDICFPYLIHTLLSGVSEFVQMAVVGHQLGIKALTAYVVADLFIKLTTDAVGYIISSGSTLYAQIAESEDKNRDYKVGVYLMISTWFYVIAMIPLVLFWSFFTEDLLLYLDLDPEIAKDGQNFAQAYVLCILISGVTCSIQYLLDTVGLQVESTIMSLIGEAFATSSIVLVMCYHTMFPNPSLTKMAWTYVFVDIIYLAAMLAAIHWYGWMEKYYTGLFSSPLQIFRNSSSNNEDQKGISRDAVKLMVTNAVQWALSNFMFEGEWQFLLFFASVLGSAELAAWGVLGIIWEELEGIVSAISEGCEVRVALTLGKGDAKSAKLITYKAIWLSMVWGILVSIVFLIYQDRIPMLITNDSLLQEMISYNLPSIALANLVSGIAQMADHILYCQNRTGLATGIAVGSSVLITLPLAGLSSYCFHFNLIGQTTAVAIGAAAFAAMAMYAVVNSDWEQVAENIRSLHADDDEDEDDDEDDDDDKDDDEEESYLDEEKKVDSPLRSSMM